MRAKSMQMGGNMSKNLRPRSKITCRLITVFITVLRGVYDQSQIFEIVKCINKCMIVDWYQPGK